MKKILMILAAVCAVLPLRAQMVIPRQEIPYDVNYHWGLIDVMIARGVVTVEDNGYTFHGTLDGTSIPWEGRIICVSDTLSATMQSGPRGLAETVTYQNGWYRRPRVSDFRSPGYDPSNPLYFKNIAGQGEYDASHDSMEAITVTSDMLGMYYFSRVIDFDRMNPGDRVSIPISGGYSSRVDITYQGKGLYTTSSGDTYPTYNCTFEYAYGGAMSGYAVECKIGATNRIPVYLSASLPAGKVEMLYAPD